jgi:large subunit ribosomal protein L22
MEVKAYLKDLRMSPRKVKIVCEQLRGKNVGDAVAILMNTPKIAAEPMLKLVKSVVANAENNAEMDVEKLYISQCFVTPGQILKRMRPVSKGRGYRVDKRTSHVTVAVTEKE